MNPYFSIWFRTRSTIDGVLNNEILFNKYVPFMVICLIPNLSKFFRHDRTLIFNIVLFIIGVIVHWLILTKFYPFILLKLGNSWKGTANLDSIKVIISLGMIPLIVGSIYDILIISITNNLKIQGYNLLIEAITWLFSFNIIIIGISKIQNFTLIQSIIYWMIPSIIILVIYLLIKY